MLTKTAITERGWTNSIISRLLGEPDRISKLGGGHVAHLYDLSRVEAAEASDAFRVLREKSARRSAAGRAAAETRAAKLLTYVQSVPINLERVKLWEIDRSIEVAKGAFRDTTDSEVWARWRINALRHEATAYDAVLAEIAGTPGIGAAYAELKSRVLDQIASSYPSLASEALRQKNAVSDC